MASFIPEYLNKFYDEEPPRDFYASVFHDELQEPGVYGDHEYNAIAVEIPLHGQIKRYTITNDLKKIDELLNSNNFIIISPISYIGKERKAENARIIYALAIDLDGIKTQQHLIDLLYQIDNGILPCPTYIVSSGSGVHLYYVFAAGVPCFQNVTKQMAKLKSALVREIWNKYTTVDYEKPQLQSLFQGFRMVGGVTKDGSRTRAFSTGDYVSIEYLNGFVEPQYQVKAVYKSSLTLEKAKKMYPDWFERRIVKGMPRGTYTINRRMYEWWLNKIKSGAKVGHRYFCIMCLAIYAIKCGVPFDEMKEDALSLIETFDKLSTDEKNRFTRADVLAAIDIYNPSYATFPVRSIEEISNIKISKWDSESGKIRQRQAYHLEEARAIRDVRMKRSGRKWTDGNGRPTKQQNVEEWQKSNPGKKKADCIRETGLAKPTVYKYWK